MPCTPTRAAHGFAWRPPSARPPPESAPFACVGLSDQALGEPRLECPTEGSHRARPPSRQMPRFTRCPLFAAVAAAALCAAWTFQRQRKEFRQVILSE